MSKNNFDYQNERRTYETKNDVTEAIHILKQFDLSPCTINFLKTFRPAFGATMRTNEYLYKKIGISESTFYKTVKRELAELAKKLGHPIVTWERAPEKLSKKRDKKVQASFLKILTSLEKIKSMVENYFKKPEEKPEEIPVESTVESTVESQAETPSESKAEEPFSHEQKRAFKKDLLKDLKDPKSLFNITGGKYKIKKSIQKFILNIKIPAFKNFMSWSQSKQYDIANTLQLALINSEANIEEPSTSYPVRNAIAACFDKYENKPREELLKLLYTYVFNRLNPEKRTASEDQSEDLEEPAAAAIEEDQLITPSLAAVLEAEKNRQEFDELLRQARKPAAYLENGQKSPEFEAFCLKESDDLPY